MLKRALFFSTPFCLSLRDGQMIVHTREAPDHLNITDKQYGDIRNFWGKIEQARPEMPQQLELF